MAWYLNRALSNFRDAVNAKWPNRDKTSDGTIGDQAHAERVSDHNPDADGSVDAWDMDVDGVDVELLKGVFEAHESSGYWIHNRQIAARTDGWKRRPYIGVNPHDKHVHWNTRGAFENSRAPWVLASDGGIDMLCQHGDVDTDARNARVAALQATLQRLGFLTGAIDGKYGNQTRDALAAACATVGWACSGDAYWAGEYAALLHVCTKTWGSDGLSGLVPHTHAFDSPEGTSGPAVAG